MRTLLIAALLAGGTQTAPAWKPPENPDPRLILDEAEEDARQGRQASSLAKFLWFHHNALKHRPSLVGVRLSFALSSWLELGRAYPPALEALTRTRAEALAAFERSSSLEDQRGAFQDFAAINRVLNEESLTAKAFLAVDAQRPAVAAQVFFLARPALIRAKAYEVCGKYLRPAEDWQAAARLHQLTRRTAESRPEQALFVEKSFTNTVATLLALLVVNGRKPEAEEIAAKARLEWDAPSFHAAIDSALAGQVPDPWP